MYLKHFGLAQYPFSLTPNTHYYLKLPSHSMAFDLLVASLQDDKYFSEITGELGTGKTILCRKILHALEVHKNQYITVYIPHPIMNAETMMQTIAGELGIEHNTSLSYYELLKLVTTTLLDTFQMQKSILIFIDEAQAMPEETLQAIRLLTTIENNSDNRLKIILFGQPELDELLDRPSLSEIKQNLSFSIQLAALSREKVDTYVEHRLVKAGYSGSQMFSEGALDLLYKSSDGVPRTINALAHKSLITAFGKAEQFINEKHVFSSILDTKSVQQEKIFAQRLTEN